MGGTTESLPQELLFICVRLGRQNGNFRGTHRVISVGFLQGRKAEESGGDFLKRNFLQHRVVADIPEAALINPSPATLEPNEEWACQQARNVMMYMGDVGIKQRFILHDRDTKFSEEFDETFRDDGIEVVKTPFQEPDANAFAESWIGNFKREVLNHFMCFGLKHLDHIAQQGVEFYNAHRPHQSKANEPLRFPGEIVRERPSGNGVVECEMVLSGLLKHYHRRAA